MRENNKRLKIAIIGSGISGLTSAYLLSKKHDITIYEKNNYIGGHTHTHKVKDNNQFLNIDSGFIVYNENTYPNFIKLLDIINVKRQHTDMGFSVKSSEIDFEYAGNSLKSIFSKKTNLFNLSFLKMIYDIIRFNKLSNKELNSYNPNLTLKEYLKNNTFSKYFINNYIIPMGAAIWSTSPKLMLDMPAYFFIKFFKNHGLLQITNRPQWWVIKNGSKQYVKKLIKNFEDNIKLNTTIKSIKRINNKIHIQLDNDIEIFDKVVIATHSDQALKLLDKPTNDEKTILNSIKYQKNIALMHTDHTILPKRKLAWSSWNYLINKNENDLVTLTYNMNILQSLKSDTTFCVTINNTKNLHKSKIIKEIVYHHPLFTSNSVKAQAKKDDICGMNNTYYCGAYWGYGFHEDGVKSALDVCKKFGLNL
jgi:uncharacterized protein